MKRWGYLVENPYGHPYVHSFFPPEDNMPWFCPGSCAYIALKRISTFFAWDTQFSQIAFKNRQALAWCGHNDI